MLEPITNEVQAQVDAQAHKHEEEKLAALLPYADALTREAIARFVAHPSAVAYVADGLYAWDEPEGRTLPDALDRLEQWYGSLTQRAGMVLQLANTAMEGPEDEPTPPEYWDKIRLQKGRTHQAAVELLAETIALAFSLDQYASARHLWRNEEVFRQSPGNSPSVPNESVAEGLDGTPATQRENV